MTAVFVVLYLLAALGANLTVAHFGPKAMPIVAFFMIGFDLTSRDVLHEHWVGGGRLRRNMALLILGGSALTVVVSLDAWRIALASALAFAGAAVTDTLIYAQLDGRVRLFKMNASNTASSLVDSLVFPLAAFGSVPAWLILAQWLTKSSGGAMWSFLIEAAIRRWGKPAPAKRPGTGPAFRDTLSPG